MGNCLKHSENDDIDLLRGNNQQAEVALLDPPPPYRVSYNCVIHTHIHHM